MILGTKKIVDFLLFFCGYPSSSPRRSGVPSRSTTERRTVAGGSPGGLACVGAERFPESGPRAQRSIVQRFEGVLHRRVKLVQEHRAPSDFSDASCLLLGPTVGPRSQFRSARAGPRHVGCGRGRGVEGPLGSGSRVGTEGVVGVMDTVVVPWVPTVCDWTGPPSTS